MNLDQNARLAVVERELTGLHSTFKDHEKADHSRFAKVSDSLVRIERILWVGVVGLAAVNGPSFLQAMGNLLK